MVGRCREYYTGQRKDYGKSWPNRKSSSADVICALKDRAAEQQFLVRDSLAFLIASSLAVLITYAGARLFVLCREALKWVAGPAPELQEGPIALQPISHLDRLHGIRKAAQHGHSDIGTSFRLFTQALDQIRNGKGNAREVFIELSLGAAFLVLFLP